MGLTTTNALVSIGVNGGALTPQANAATLSVAAGAALVFALQSTPLVQVWDLTLQDLDNSQLTYSFQWTAGQQNRISFQVGPSARRLAFTSTVSDGASSYASAAGTVVSSISSTSGNIGQFNLPLVNGVNHDVTTDGTALQLIGGPTAAFTLTGLQISASPLAGRPMKLVNGTAFSCTILFADPSSSAGNRFAGNRGSPSTVLAPLILAPNGGECEFIYDANNSCIRITGSGWRYRDVSDARDFVADPNGFTTGVVSSTAFTAMLADAVANQTQPKIPAGNFFIDRPIVIDNEAICELSGATSGGQPVTLGTAQLTHTFVRTQFVGDAIVVVTKPTPPAYYTKNGFHYMPLLDPVASPGAERYINLSMAGPVGSLAGVTALRLEVQVDVPLGNGAFWSLACSQGQRGNETIAQAFEFFLNPSSRTGTGVNVSVSLKTTGTSGVVTAGALSAADHELAVTWDGSTLRLYIDGAIAGSTACTGTIVQQPWETFLFGAQANNWPDGVHGIDGGPFSIASIRLCTTMASDGATKTACAAYTGSTYTPSTSDRALDTYTQWLQNFDPAHTTAFANGQFVIGQTNLSDPGHLVSPGYSVYSLIMGASVQNRAVHIHDIGIQSAAGGILIYACPDSQVKNCSVYAPRGVTFYNNTYTGLVERLFFYYPLATTPTFHHWAFAAVDASGNGEVRDCISVGGTYGYVQVLGTNMLRNIYHVSVGLGGAYWNESGGIAAFSTADVEWCDFSDEAGRVDDAQLFVGNVGRMRVVGGVVQTSAGGGPPNLKADGLGRLFWDTITWVGAGSQGIKVLSQYGQGQRAFTILGELQNNGQQPWTDTACPVVLRFPEVDESTAVIDFTATSASGMVFGGGAGQPTFNNFFDGGTLKFTDSGSHLGGATTVKLSMLVGRRHFWNATAFDLTIEGPTGTGFVLHAGKQRDGEGDGTNWAARSAEF